MQPTTQEPSRVPFDRFEKSKKQLSTQACAFLEQQTENTDLENTARYKEYKAFAAAQKREVIRKIKQEIVSEAAKARRGRDAGPLSRGTGSVAQNPGDISIDLGVFGQTMINGATLYDAYSGLDSYLGTATLDEGTTLYNENEPGPTKVTFSSFPVMESRIKELIEVFESSREAENELTFNDPNFSIDTEISFLKKIPNVLKQIVERKKAQDSNFLPNKSSDDIFNPGLTLEETSFTFDFSAMDNVGRSAKVSVEVSVLATENQKLKTEPFTRQRTMNYFRNMSIILAEPLGIFSGVSDCDIGPGKTTAGKISMILKYTRDLSIVDTPSLYDPIHDWTQERVVQPFADWYSRPGPGSGTGVDIVTGIAGLGTTTQYGTALALPVLSQACDTAEILEKFLRRFSIPSLLCDLAKCLRLPGINLKIPDLSLPSPPSWKLFTLEDLTNFWKKVRDVMVQIFKKILCAFVQGILDILNTPFCNTKLEELIFAPQLNSDFEMPRKALLDALTDLGIPKTLEATDEAKSLFDDLTNVLTPSEICALLNGEEVSSEVYVIISRMAEQKGLIFESFQDRESIKRFFDTVGVFVDEDLCDQLGSFDDQLGTYTCNDTASLMRLLREKLQNNNASDAEIEAALEAANRDLLTRAKALEALTDINSLSSLFPETITPGAEGSPIQSLPSSVEATSAAMLQAFTAPVKFSYLSSLRDFGNSFFMESAIVPQVGDPGYNEQATLDMEASLERLRLYSENLQPDTPLLERSLEDLSTILDHVCQKFKTFDVAHPEHTDENGRPITARAHIKEYKIINIDSGDIALEGPLTSQQELNDKLTLLNEQNENTSYSVEVSLEPAGVEYRLKYPIQLSRVIFVGEETPENNITQILNEEELDSALSRADQPVQEETIKIGIINKINERLQATSQEVINNVESATQNSFSSELLKNLKQIFDSNAEALREGSPNELIQFYKTSEGQDYELLVTDKTSRNRVKYSTDISSGTHDRYSISIQDPNTTETGEEIVLNFCTKIPDEILDDDFFTNNSTKQHSFFKAFRKSFSRSHEVSEANLSRTQVRSFIDSKVSQIGGSLFESLNEGIFEQLFFNFEKSDIFNEEYVERISRLVAGELFLTEDESGNLCISNKYELNSDTELSFEGLIIKDFIKEVMSEFSKKENEVSNIDYSELTAAEKAMANLIVKGLVRICILEVALKSSINLSVFSFRKMISTYEFGQYVSEICVNNILRVPALTKPETRGKLVECVKRITGSSSLKAGLLEIVRNELLPIAEAIDKIFARESEPGSLYDFYINNLQNLDIPVEKSENEEWVLDPRLQPSKVNPFIYFENYVKLDGPLANPATFRTPIAMQRAYNDFESTAPSVYEDLSISKPDISYLINYSNNLEGMGLSFLNDSTTDKEIISIKDFRSLVDAVTGGPDSLFVRAERDVKLLFQDGPLAGRPRFLQNTPSAAYQIDRRRYKFNGAAIIRNAFQPDDTQSSDDIRNSRMDTAGGQNLEFFIERAPGAILNTDLSSISIPTSTDDYSGFGIRDPYLKAIEESEQINFITTDDLPGTRVASEEVRGITRVLNLNSPGNQFEIRNGYVSDVPSGTLVFEAPVYNKVPGSVYRSYPDDLKVNVEEMVIDLVDDAAPTYDTLGEIDTRHTDEDWENLRIPPGYINDMAILKSLMKSDDPDFTGTEAGPFKFRGRTGCFVHGIFGFTYLEDPGGRNLLPPVDGKLMDLWAACRENDFNFHVGTYPNVTTSDGSSLQKFLMIDNVTTNEEQYGDEKPRLYITDNQYDIPTRILITRYDVSNQFAQECYANFKIPSFLESTNSLLQAQQILNAWHELVRAYIDNVRRAFRFLRSGENGLGISQALINDTHIANDPELRRPLAMRDAYELVKAKSPEFPVFYSRYMYAQGFDEANPPNVTPLYYRNTIIRSAVRKSFFNREKLLRQICFREVANGQGPFSNNKAAITEMFKDRGRLLKQNIPSKIHQAPNLEVHQMFLDKASYAGHLYFENFQDRLTPTVYKFKSTIDSLIRWFGQRRHDSLWGRTYTSRVEKSPNLKIEKPGILCGTSPFYADGRCSITEINLAFLAMNNRVNERYIQKFANSDTFDIDGNNAAVGRLITFYNKIFDEARETIREFITRTQLNIDRADPRDKYLFTAILERDTIEYLDSYGMATKGQAKQPFFYTPRQRMRIKDGVMTFETDVRGGVSSDGGSGEYDSFGIGVHNNTNKLINWKNNTLSLLRGSQDPIPWFVGYVPLVGSTLNGVEISGRLSQGKRNQLAGYGIHYESDKMFESPVHYLNSIGIDTSREDEVRKLLPRSRSIVENAIGRSIASQLNITNRSNALFRSRNQKSAIMLSFLTSRAMNAGTSRNRRIFNRLRQAYNFSVTMESEYDNALNSIGITQLVRILYRGLTDQAGEAEDFLYNQYFMNTEISQGIRMMMCVPDKSESKLGIESNLVNYPSLKTLTEEQRMGNVVDSSGQKYETYFMTNFEEVIDLENKCWNTTSLERLEARYRELSNYRFERIQEEKEFLTYFKYLIPIDRLASTAAIYNTTLLGSYNTFPLLLNSTKNMMGTMFYEAVKKTINGSVYSDNTLGDLGISTLDGPSVFDTTAKNARPGGSKRGDCDLFPVDFGTWINMLGDMLEEFVKFVPSMILRGIANQIDPAYREMKHHWNSCNLDGFSFVGKRKDGRGDPIKYYTAKRSLQLGVDKRKPGQRAQQGQYAPVNFAFPADLIGGVVQLDFTQMQRSINKFITYIYAGQLPFLDPSYAFQIPCFDIDNAGDSAFNWDKFKFGQVGRYGHPVTPFTYLALLTPVMRRDVKDQRLRCQILEDGTLDNNTTRSDLPEC